ncbi:hypothetical protein [Hallella mizrahii]|uniref:Uncharacterized protein n=1 Tax=Hallella mizrahii TaxID=2606637 RepID=A0A7K0KIA3_9BACT|nr:hypothetical protein [Hallella mizrahii]MST85609.1 hypothetical protein [Hallella mizrahii]
MTWKQNNQELTLLLLTTGTHSDIFGKKKRQYASTRVPCHGVGRPFY